MIQITRTLRSDHVPTPPEATSRLQVVTIAEAAVAVTAFAHVAAYAEAATAATHWGFGLAMTGIGLIEVVRGSLVASVTAIPFLACVAFILGLPSLFDLLARPSTRLTAWLARTRGRQQKSSSTEMAVLVVLLFALFVFLLNWFVMTVTEEELEKHTVFSVVTEAGAEFVVVHYRDDKAWAFAYDRPRKRLCSELRVFKVDEKFRAVREELGLLAPPMPKRANTDACLRPLVPPPTPGQTSTTVTK